MNTRTFRDKCDNCFSTTVCCASAILMNGKAVYACSDECLIQKLCKDTRKNPLQPHAQRYNPYGRPYNAKRSFVRRDQEVDSTENNAKRSFVRRDQEVDLPEKQIKIHVNPRYREEIDETQIEDIDNVEDDEM